MNFTGMTSFDTVSFDLKDGLSTNTSTYSKKDIRLIYTELYILGAW
jgi:hypothetical protein